MRQASGSGRSGFTSRTNRCVPVAAGVIAAVCVVAPWARGDVIGADQLRALDPTLNGSGVRVGQVEANIGGNPPAFEVRPDEVNVLQPPGLFTYYSSNGTSTTFNDGVVGAESGHANAVAAYFYGRTIGVATNVSHVDNYDADYFLNTLIPGGGTTAAQVVNQSFIVTDDTPAHNPIQDPTVDQQYDNYIATYNKVVVSGVGNSGKPASPSTSYNGIAVGAYQGGTAVGPTTDLRSKPDIVAPAGETSYSTPQVSGAAAILLQAGARGDGGAGTAASAQDFRTIKALLLNGATKPAGWTHTPTAPLDPTYGAGVLNVYNSYQQLAAGRHAFIASTTVPLNGAALPPAGTGNEPTGQGWDLNTITSGTASDAANHYFLVIPAGGGTLTATLDWERQFAQATVNDLDLLLYNADTNALVDSSVSTTDNVEHLYDLNLPAGRYDLEVLKHGGPAVVSNGETYALAYNVASMPEPVAVVPLAALAAYAAGRRRRRVRA